MDGDVLETAPRLDGWMTAAQAAEVLGITRQAVAKMMSNGVFRTIHAIGDRPLYVVRAEEIAAFHEAHEKSGDWTMARASLAKVGDRRVGVGKR